MSANEMSTCCLQFSEHRNVYMYICIYVLSLLFKMIELNITIWIPFKENAVEIPHFLQNSLTTIKYRENKAL